MSYSRFQFVFTDVTSRTSYTVLISEAFFCLYDHFPDMFSCDMLYDAKLAMARHDTVRVRQSCDNVICDYTPDWPDVLISILQQ
jgi:hypothetical protein